MLLSAQETSNDAQQPRPPENLLDHPSDLTKEPDREAYYDESEMISLGELLNVVEALLMLHETPAVLKLVRELSDSTVSSYSLGGQDVEGGLRPFVVDLVANHAKNPASEGLRNLATCIERPAIEAPWKKEFLLRNPKASRQNKRGSGGYTDGAGKNMWTRIKKAATQGTLTMDSLPPPDPSVQSTKTTDMQSRSDDPGRGSIARIEGKKKDRKSQRIVPEPSTSIENVQSAQSGHADPAAPEPSEPRSLMHVVDVNASPDDAVAESEQNQKGSAGMQQIASESPGQVAEEPNDAATTSTSKRGRATISQDLPGKEANARRRPPVQSHSQESEMGQESQEMSMSMSSAPSRAQDLQAKSNIPSRGRPSRVGRRRESDGEVDGDEVSEDSEESILYDPEFDNMEEEEEINLLKEKDAEQDQKQSFWKRFHMNKLRWEELNEKQVERMAKPTFPFIVHPNNIARAAWDVWVLVLIVVDSIAVPLDIGFDIQTANWWFWTSTFFFLSDIFMTLFTGFYVEGILVMQWKYIVRHYLRTWMAIDVCSTVPWEFVMTGSTSQTETRMMKVLKIGKLMRVLRLLRIMKLKELFNRLEDLFESYVVMVGLSLAKVLVVFALLCHWTACIWGFLGNPEKVDHGSAGLPPHPIGVCSEGGPCENGMEGSPWLRRYGFDNFKPSVSYLAALHFATGLVTGSEMDLQPGYLGERIFCTVMMIVSFLVCSTFISQIVVVIHKINAGSAEFRERMRNAKEFMVSRRVPYILQAKIKRYLEYQRSLQTRKQSNHENFDLLNRLSPWLRLELTEHLNKHIISRHPFFRWLPPRVLKRVCGAAKTVLYAPGDLVVQKGQRASCMCFIVRGKIRVLRADPDAQQDEKNKGAICLSPPSWIGDLCLFKDVIRSKTVISVTHSELLTIHKETIMQLIQEFPKTLPYYRDYQKKVLSGDLASAGIICEYCGDPGHFVADCPKLKEFLEEKNDPRKSKLDRGQTAMMRATTKVLDTAAAGKKLATSKLKAAVNVIRTNSKRPSNTENGQNGKFSNLSKGDARQQKRNPIIRPRSTDEGQDSLSSFTQVGPIEVQRTSSSSNSSAMQKTSSKMYAGTLNDVPGRSF